MRMLKNWISVNHIMSLWKMLGCNNVDTLLVRAENNLLQWFAEVSIVQNQSWFIRKGSDAEKLDYRKSCA